MPFIVEDAEAIRAATKLGRVDRKGGRQRGMASMKAVACRMTLPGKADAPSGIGIRIRG